MECVAGGEWMADANDKPRIRVRIDTSALAKKRPRRRTGAEQKVIDERKAALRETRKARNG